MLSAKDGSFMKLILTPCRGLRAPNFAQNGKNDFLLTYFYILEKQCIA